MTIATYPAIVERAGDAFSVYFPDLPGCTSGGSTVTEAVINAEQALAGHILVSLQHGDEIPAPSELTDLVIDGDVEVAAFVLIRAEMPGKSVRINITMDEGLVAAIDKVANNRSAFLAEAARDALARKRELVAA